MTDSDSSPEEQTAEPSQEASRTELRASLRSAALEAGLVVLGVILAFAANEWRKGNEAEERARLALEAVALELETNALAVASSLGYHQTKMFGLREAMEAGETVPPRFFDQGFVHPAQLLSTAWDAATATDAVHGWDYDQLLVVSRLYGSQERYEVQSLGVSQVIYEHLIAEGTAGLVQRQEQLAVILSTFWWRECELLSEYSDVLPGLGRSVPEISSVCPSAARKADLEG